MHGSEFVSAAISRIQVNDNITMPICSLGGPTGACRGSTPHICSHMRFGRLLMAHQLIEVFLGAFTDQ